MRYSHHTIKAGTTSKLVLVYGREESGAGATGLTPVTEGAHLAFAREGEQGASRYSLRDGEPGRYTEGGLAEVDPELVPGLYQLGLPDEVLAEGSTRAFVKLVVEGAVFDPIEIALVAYDPQDPERMGVEGLANARRHEFLRRALPRLTEMELSLGVGVERALRARRGEHVAADGSAGS